METWQPAHVYPPRTLVVHKGQVYRKLDDGDNTEPDNVPGGWELVQAENLTEFLAIHERFSTYEARRDAAMGH